MKKIALILLGMGVGLGMQTQAAVVYQDSFDNDGLGTNAGIGGGASNRSIFGGANWSDNGNLNYSPSGSNFQNRSVAYSNNAWVSGQGFELTVNYTTSNIGTSLANLFSFGLISSDTDLSTYSGLNFFGRNTENSHFSIGVNLSNAQSGAHAGRGLNYTDGSSVTSLDLSGDNVQFVTGASTPVVISVVNDNAGGANWSYSINGTTEASGNVASFDFTKSYRFAVYGQDNEYAKSIQSVTLNTFVPEPSTFVLLGLGALVLHVRRIS